MKDQDPRARHPAAPWPPRLGQAGLALLVALVVGVVGAAGCAKAAVGAGFELATSVMGPRTSGSPGTQALGSFDVVFELDAAFHVSFGSETAASAAGQAALLQASVVRFRLVGPDGRVAFIVGLGSATVQGNPSAVPLAEFGLRWLGARYPREVYVGELGIELAYRFLQGPGNPPLDLSGLRVGVTVGLRF